MIVSDGKFKGQSIDAVIKIDTDNNKSTSTIKEFIYGKLEEITIEELEESLASYGDAYKNEGFAVYTLKNRKSFEDFSKQRENGRRLNFHFEDNENGTRSNREVRFDLKIGNENITINGFRDEQEKSQYEIRTRANHGRGECELGRSPA